MSKTQEALKMAIEWIEADWKPTNKDTVIKACKEALAEPLWKSLSDDEMTEIIEKHDGVFGAVVRAIEQALKEKNHE